MSGFAARWPMRRDSREFMEGFQRGYAEALQDVQSAGADALNATEALRAVADTAAGPESAAARWVSEDDGSVP